MKISFAASLGVAFARGQRRTAVTFQASRIDSETSLALT